MNTNILVGEDGDVLISKSIIRSYNFFLDHEMEEVNVDYNRILGIPLMRDHYFYPMNIGAYILFVTMDGRLLRVNRNSSEFIHVELGSPINKIVRHSPIVVLDVTDRLMFLDDEGDMEVLNSIDDVKNVVSVYTTDMIILTKNNELMESHHDKIDKLNIRITIQINNIHGGNRNCIVSDTRGNIYELVLFNRREMEYELRRISIQLANDYIKFASYLYILGNGTLRLRNIEIRNIRKVRHERKFNRFIIDVITNSFMIEDDGGNLYHLKNLNHILNLRGNDAERYRDINSDEVMEQINLPVRLMNPDSTPVITRRLKNPRTRIDHD